MCRDPGQFPICKMSTVRGALQEAVQVDPGGVSHFYQAGSGRDFEQAEDHACPTGCGLPYKCPQTEPPTAARPVFPVMTCAPLRQLEIGKPRRAKIFGPLRDS
jgi:hypothetical protein